MEPITAMYVREEEDYTVTVAGLGKEYSDKAPGIIAARDRADQLIEEIAPRTGSDEDPTVVHLLNGSAFEFTSAYMTARLSKSETSTEPADGDAAADTTAGAEDAELADAAQGDAAASDETDTAAISETTEASETTEVAENTESDEVSAETADAGDEPAEADGTADAADGDSDDSEVTQDEATQDEVTQDNVPGSAVPRKALAKGPGDDTDSAQTAEDGDASSDKTYAAATSGSSAAAAG